MTTELTPEQCDALEHARALVRAGIPVFAAAPCPDGCTTPGHRNTEFHLPKAWQQIRPSMRQVERWKPGWALAAIGGWTADFIDVDDHHGGDVSEKMLRENGGWPRYFGVQSTPSGGKHYLISPLHERRNANVLPGVDYQGGTGSGADGEGRAFVWLAPTVKRSKNVEDGGALGTYAWIEPPDLEMLAEFAGSDDSGQHFRDLVVASHGLKPEEIAENAGAAAPATVLDDPFVTSSQITAVAGAGGAGQTARRFTVESAEAFIAPALKDLREAIVGGIEEMCNRAAAQLSHFVPAFMDADTAMWMLTEALGHTAYDPNGPSDWTVEKFVPVLDGRRPLRDNWKAERVESDSLAGKVAENEEIASDVDALIGRMLTAEQMADRPAPEPLVWGLLDRDSLAAVVGMPGSFKSFWALDLAGHIGRGMEWHGHRVHKGLCVYIAAEGDRGMTLRTRAWTSRYGPMENVLFLPEPVQIADAKAWDVLVKACEKLQPVFVVADTQSMMTLGMEENSNSEMNVAMHAFRRIQKSSGACVLAVHHTTKDGSGVRGGSAQEGAHDTRIRLARLEPRKSMIVRMKDEKQKDMAEGESVGIKLLMEVVDLGNDPETGRPLSSLVMSDRDADAFEEASGEERPQDIGQEDVLPEPLIGWQRVGVAEAPLQERALTVLLEVAGPEGITETTVKRLVVERWHPNGTGSKAGQLRNSAWQAAWGKALAREWNGESLIVSGRTGDRYRVNDLVAGQVKTAASPPASG